LDKWTSIEAERFRNPVLRLFHTELEAVYEEKNRGLDNDGRKMYEAMLAGLFPTNTYGTQTTIGTIDHLKNPSLVEIKKFYDRYYIPNNMAICLSGDFDPDETIKLIDEKMGKWKMKPLVPYQPAIEKPITQVITKEVYGPQAENIYLAYRFPGANTADADLVYMVDKILANGKAGLIDLDLNQKQQVLGANSSVWEQKDYSIHILNGDPKNGQTLDQVKDLLLQEIEKIKKGEFPDWLLPAIINNIKLQDIKSYESNNSRASAFVDAFINNTKWADYVNRNNRLAKITKQQIIDFVKKNYSNNYVVVYKRTGEDKNVQKVTKPAITPVKVNRSENSDFLKAILEKPAPEIQPVFVDYNKDINKLKIKNGIEVLYTPNTENKTFNLYYIVDMGTNQNKKLKIAVEYLQYLGTKKFTPAQIQEEFFKLGCSYSVNTGEEQVWVSLNGLTENFEKALGLFEDLLMDAQPNEDALKNLIADIKKEREDVKKNKQQILSSALYSYARYGKNSPFTNILSASELDNLKSSELTDIIHQLTSYEHRVLYYGSNSPAELTATLNKMHQVPTVLKALPAPVDFKENEANNNVYVVDYDMKQAEVVLLSRDIPYNKEIVPQVKMFNQYFGAGFGSIVFQEIRESKALAYSVSSSYRNATKKSDNNYVYSYIGTQADKLPEAMAGMMNLFENMPESETAFKTSKEAIIQSIRSERITKTAILFSYENAKRLGLDYDIRKDVYTKVPTMTFEEVKNFEQSHLKGKKYSVLTLGKKDALDLKTLEKYGPVTFLTLEDIFGY
jgi:predicted Zn-dependent peptidase